jgi:hypothetical protein
MSISPSYRGASSQFVIASKTQDFKFPQSTWNLDKMDGTGPSGYNIDLSRMQMFYIDYSWYGAGSIRWGFRAANGNVTYCHRVLNNNVNTEAYMRTGNLPARYESLTQPPTTILGASFDTAATTLTVSSSAGFPLSGTLCIRDASKYEYVTYQGTGSTTFNIVRREQSGSLGLPMTMASGSNVALITQSATASLQIGQRVIGPAFPDGTFISAISQSYLILTQAATSSNPTALVAPMGVGTASVFTFSATAPVAVELAYPTFAPSISHWGTSVIMDGRFDDDKSLLFTYGQSVATNIPVGQTRALFSIRIAPSVDNGLPAAFGARELTNRMQLVLRQLGVATNQTVSGSNINLLVRANLNGIPSGSVSVPWTNAVSGSTTAVNSSLAQIADYGGQNYQVVGGETTAGFFVDGTGTSDLSLVRDLGNSILGGGGLTSNIQIYPDGPDVLTFTAQNVGLNTVNVFGRLGWTEAQA